MVEVECHSKKNNWIYMSHEGLVVPCCWIGSHGGIETLSKSSNIPEGEYDIHNHSVEDIMEGPMWKWIDDNMNEFSICVETCGKKNKDKIIGLVNL